MDRVRRVNELWDQVQSTLDATRKDYQDQQIADVETNLDKLLKRLLVIPADLKKQLSTDPRVLGIRNAYNAKEKSIDLDLFAKKMGLKVKKVTLDHIIFGYAWPADNLTKLHEEFEAIDSDTDGPEKTLADWRGELRSRSSESDIVAGISDMIQNLGLPYVRQFAEKINVRDPKTKKKIAKNAGQAKLVEALASHLWNEKQNSRALEGR